MRSGTIQWIPIEAINRAYNTGHELWIGCDWPTSFGDTGLDLNGMTSHQALLMARATAGKEAADWREAVRWLRMIESDAETAEADASRAVELAARGDFAAGGQSARAACDREARYHPIPVWTELRDVLENANRAAHDRRVPRSSGHGNEPAV